MSKNSLVELLHERTGTYLDFLRNARANTASEKWGMGIGHPFSLEPYRMETLGIKPGRMLKKKSEPAKGRYQYSYDSAGRVIHMCEYAEWGGPPGDKAWIKSDDFYEYPIDSAFRYVFGNTFKDDPSSELTRIVQAHYENGLITKISQLENDETLEYTETLYSYDGNGKIIRIQTQWPYGPYPDKVMELEQGDSNVKIFAIENHERFLIYPEP
ncbi:MAG: hypothetical protein FWC42_09565 [Proteobacteria bacterium]|nr:hypothetical protein [Pseudomonadota bacterium]